MYIAYIGTERFAQCKSDVQYVARRKRTFLRFIVLPNRTSLTRNILVQYKNNNALNTTGRTGQEQMQYRATFEARNICEHNRQSRTGSQLKVKDRATP